MKAILDVLHVFHQANSVAACERACQIEYEFLCRSFLYKGPPSANTYNCQLFHLDHHTFPDGVNTYTSTDRWSSKHVSTASLPSFHGMSIHRSH